MRPDLPFLDPRARAGHAAATALVGLLAFAFAACGPGNPPQGFGQDEHAGDMVIGATAVGSGELAIEYDFEEPVVVTETASVAGFTLYSASDPGFDLLVRDEPEASFFVLADDVEISLEIVAIEPGVQLKIEGVVLDAPGATTVLGTTPELHAHPEWQLVLPEGATPGEYNVSFKLTTSAAAYSESAIYAATIAVGEG